MAGKAAKTAHHLPDPEAVLAVLVQSPRTAPQCSGGRRRILLAAATDQAWVCASSVRPRRVRMTDTGGRTRTTCPSRNAAVRPV